MNAIFELPKSINIKIEVHFQGRKINKLFYIKYPEHFINYPSFDEVMRRRADLLLNRIAGAKYTIVLCEDGLYVIES